MGQRSDAELKNVTHQRIDFSVQNALKLAYKQLKFQKLSRGVTTGSPLTRGRGGRGRVKPGREGTERWKGGRKKRMEGGREGGKEGQGTGGSERPETRETKRSPDFSRAEFAPLPQGDRNPCRKRCIYLLC